ncbi:GPI inositol-deacylase [Raphidocelis subcapitata]|uniref:GPI inositol-deacylase n=1 Tax=Raphidocelis subcapitata TaxID=307507 RepID=A0A2V0PKQ6_9CHLO|nr:GPI inositol-deacylase [Raphidocelis subcapitata]|eukprot:GBF98593.1 GPI inositol-deacylase [Raphidocelis subcapitata]
MGAPPAGAPAGAGADAGAAAPAAPAPAAAAPVHLFVIQHGLWGNRHNMLGLVDHFEATLVARGGRERLVLENSGVNERRKTHDGVDACGDRLAQLILARTAALKLDGHGVVKLSLLGYSLGGLMCRYAVGKLYAVGYFDNVQPVNFITVATPHLGSAREPDGLWSRLVNAHVPIIASRSGHQLMLLDRSFPLPGARAAERRRRPLRRTEEEPGASPGLPRSGSSGSLPARPASPAPAGAPGAAAFADDAARVRRAPSATAAALEGRLAPLLVVMAHPGSPFLAGLARFRRRVRVANVSHDVSVPYCTAAMRTDNPYLAAPPVPIDAAAYPSVVRPALPGEAPAGRAKARGDKGLVAALLLSPLYAPLLPLAYAGYVASTLVHFRVAAARAPDARWLADHPVLTAASSLVVARLSAMHRLLSSELPGGDPGAGGWPRRSMDGGWGGAATGGGAPLGPAASVVVAAAADYVSGRRSVGAARPPVVVGEDLWGAVEAAASPAACGSAAVATRGSVGPRGSRSFSFQQPVLGLGGSRGLSSGGSRGLSGGGSRGLSSGGAAAAAAAARRIAASQSVPVARAASGLMAQTLSAAGGSGLQSLLLPSASPFAAAGGRAMAWAPSLETVPSSRGARQNGDVGGPSAFAPPQQPPQAGLRGAECGSAVESTPFATVQQKWAPQLGGSGAASPFGGSGGSSRADTPRGEASFSDLPGAASGGDAAAASASGNGMPSLHVRTTPPAAGSAARSAVWPPSPASASSALASASSILASAGSAVAPDSPGLSLDESDALQLRAALDSVGEGQRRALLAGKAALPEDNDGVLAGGFAEQQAWIAKHLTRLRWLAADVDVGVVRSHAAVINRDRLFTKTARLDALAFLSDHFLL